MPGNNEPLVSVIDANVEIAKNERDVGFQLHGTAGKNGKKEFSSGAFEHVCFTFADSDFTNVKNKLIKYGYQCREGYDFMPIYKQIWTIDPNGVKVEFLFKSD